MEISINLPVVEQPGFDPFRGTFELAALAEELGFHGVFVGHHHFTPGYETAPWVVLAAVAARTERIRLGTSVFLLPTHHPLDIAEQVATLDRISAGRVIVGVGLGYRAYEYEAFQLPYRRRGARLEEALEILPKVWTGQPVTHRGEQFAFDDVVVYPTPLQRPHPPIWVGAVARAAQDRAARLGDGWMSDIMEPLERERVLADRYRGLCERHGRTPTVCLLRTAAIAERRDDLESSWLARTAAWQLGYWRAGARGRDDDGVFSALERGDEVPLERFAHDRLIAGTPEDCITQLRRWSETVRPDHVLLGLQGPDEGLASQRAAIELFGREVLPEVRRWGK